MLSLVAAQNRALAALAIDSDTILAPLARDRAHVADFVVAAGTTAEATAERRAALEQDIAKLPAFLQALVPNMQRLGALADAATPTLQDLHVAAPDINRAVTSLGPFATAALPAFQSLGAAAVLGTPALRNALPVLRQLRQTSSTLKPVLANLAPLLESLQSTGGIERVMDYLFYQTAAINGFDSIGHYLRAGLIVNTCSAYAITPASGCSANFPPGASKAQSAAAISGPRDETLKSSGGIVQNTGAAACRKAPARTKQENDSQISFFEHDRKKQAESEAQQGNNDEALALARLIGQPAECIHADHGADIGQRRQEANIGNVHLRKVFDYGWQPNHKGIMAV